MTPHLGVQRATSSVVLFAMMHVFAHFCFWTSSILLYMLLAAFGILPMNVGTALVLFCMTVFCSCGIYLFIRGYRYGMVRRFFAFLSHIPGLRGWSRRMSEEHREDFGRIDKQIAELHSQERYTFYKSLLIEYVGRVCQSFEILFMLLLFDSNENLFLSFLYSFLILSFTSLFANLPARRGWYKSLLKTLVAFLGFMALLTLVTLVVATILLGFLPLQLGGREGGFAISVSALGMTSALGMFISIICRVRELFWAVIGLGLMRCNLNNEISKSR